MFDVADQEVIFFSVHDRDSNPAPCDFLSERLTSELGRPSSVGLRSDKRPSGPGSIRPFFLLLGFFAGFHTTAASGSGRGRTAASFPVRDSLSRSALFVVAPFLSAIIFFGSHFYFDDRDIIFGLQL